MTIFLGILFIIIGLFFLKWLVTNYQISPISRPMIFSSPIFVILGTILESILLLGGFFLVFRSSFNVGLIFLAIIVLMFLLSKRGSNIKATKDSMYKTFEIVKNAYKDSNVNEMDEKEKREHERNILFHTLEPRYRYSGKYDTETLMSIVNEYPNIESLTSFVILFEFFEELYPAMNIESLRDLVRDALKTIKESESDLYSSIKDYINDYQKTLYSLRR